MLRIQRHPSRRDLAWFGIALTVFFGVLGAIVLWHTGAVAVARGLWLTGGLLVVVYYAVPPLRRPLFLAWSYLTYPLGWLLSYLALALIYYGLMTPIGLLLRLFGKDPMERRIDPGSSSYWVPRPPPPGVERYFRQY